MSLTIINECPRCHNQTKEIGQKKWECPYCGAIYSIGTHYDGTEFAYPVAPPKELPCGKMGERASQISVDKIEVKEIKPPKTIESDVYRNSNDLDYHDIVNLITIFLEKGEWEEASDKICKLRNLGDSCSVGAATWYEMAFDRHAHNDSELVRSFSNITEAEVSRLDNILPYVMPDFRNRILNLILNSGYVGDESTVMLFTYVLPYVFNETIYSVKERKTKIEYAFDKVISLGYPKTFKYLLTHALADNEVDQYISYLEKFAQNCTPVAAQEYYAMILAVDPGNIAAHRSLVQADIEADAPADKCIADFENLILYSQAPKNDVEKFISILVNERTTTESKSNFMWALLGYYHEDEEQQKRAMSKYADLLLASKLWDKATDFYSAVLSKNTQDATVYFQLCLADMHFSNIRELIASDASFKSHPYYCKALALAVKTDSEYAEKLKGLMDSQKNRIQDEQEKKKKRTKLLLTGVAAVVAIVAIILTIVLVGNVREYKRYSHENIVLTIEDKVEPTKNSSYYDGYVIAFDVNIANNSILDIIQVRGELAVYNAEGNLLITADCTFSSLTIEAGKDETLVLNIDCRESDKVLELYYADCDDISATFKLTEVIYEGYESREYDEEPVTILALKVGSDGVSTTEKSYQDALALFNQGKYAEAAPLFEALGLYKESYNYYNQCCTNIETANKDAAYNNAMSLYAQGEYGEAINVLNEIYGYKDSADKIDEIILSAESKAKAAATTGDYVGACTILEKLGYTSSNSKLYKAYAYASEGYFADAVQYGLTVVVIPEGVESIPDNYFKDANHSYALEKVVLPSTIKSIGSSAFYGCSKLTEINLPTGIVTINPSAFNGCSSLTTIVFPEGLTTIGNNAFAYCSKLKQIQWSSTILTIGNNAFKSCDSLTSLALPSKITSIGTGAFTECDGLLTISIPGSIKTISESAFSGCTRLTQVTINSGTEVIGAYAFSNCPMLSTITLADTLKEIKNNAFYQCTALTEVTIPAQVTLIGNYAFYGCSSLQRVYFDNTEGWVKDGWSNLTVTDAQKNAQKLVLDSAGTWKRN